MKHLAPLCSFMFLSSCSTMPMLYDSVEHIADDKAIDVMISREAIQEDTNIDISLEIRNRKGWFN
jgi:hypothetical protein